MSRSLEPGKLGDWLLHVMHERVGKAENFAGIVGVRSCRQSQGVCYSRPTSLAERDPTL